MRLECWPAGCHTREVFRGATADGSVLPALIQNVALILAAALMQRFILDRGSISSPRTQLLSGLLFGVAAIVAMSLPYTLQSGVIFDARTVVLSTGALFGGALVALVASVLAVAYRLFYLGGAGAWVGVAVILTAAGAGSTVRLMCGGRLSGFRYWHFLAFGLLVHTLSVLWFVFLPVDYRRDILLGLAPVYVPLLTLATLAMAALLRELNAMRDYEQSLLDSRSRMQHLFESSGVAIFDEDFTELLAALSSLRDAGVSDIRRYLTEWPDEVDRLAALVRVVWVNPAAVALFAVTSRTELIGPMHRFFSGDARRVFVEEIAALCEGGDIFRTKTTFSRADGSLVDVIIVLPIPTSPEDARHVPVSLIDISGLR